MSHKHKIPRTHGAVRAVQAAAVDADINRIAARHGMRSDGTLSIPQQPGAHRQPNWGDWEAEDFQATLNRVADAKIAFASLPARLRARFGNQPYQLVRWVNDPRNLHEAVAHGLISPPEGYIPPKNAEKPPQQDLEVQALRAELEALKAQNSAGGAQKTEK